MARRIGVVMGGWGEEKQVSLKTGEAIAAALATRGHAVQRIAAGPGLDRALRAAEPDAVVLALHGRMGEDGRVQGLLEVLEIPYTGSGVLASALAMNKEYAKRLFRLHNLPTPTGYAVTLEELPRLDELHRDLGFPCVVKPACGGSSVGVSVAHDVDELPPAVLEACRYGGIALVERQVVGREITVGILGDQVLGSCEISFSAESFDYEHKYDGGSRYFLPPRLSATRIANIEALALAAYRSLGCRGYGRVDLIASDHANDVLLEVNTLPGMTPTSLLPKIARRAGLSFEALVEEIVGRAALDPASVAPPVARGEAAPRRAG